MTKTKQAEKEIRKRGFSIEWVTSPRGTQIVKATKGDTSTKYETTVIKLAKHIIDIYS